MFKSGDQIGSYILKSQIGKGAFGVVWLAEETTRLTSHKVALKLPSNLDVNIETIRQEAFLWEQVKGHPNILPIIKADIADDQIYIASEYAPDGSLADWIAKNQGSAPTPLAAIEMTKGILAGLAHLHSKSVIHRDLKPENILLQGEIPRIADFGIARMLKDTQSLQMGGTPNYMAPEGFNGARSIQTDIWAVGIIFYQLMTGLFPYPNGDFLSIVKAIVYDEPQIERTRLPEQIYSIISKALQKDLSKRYANVAEMVEDLRKFNSFAAQNNSTAETLPDSTTPRPQTAQRTEVLEQTIPIGQADTNAEKNRETLVMDSAVDTMSVGKGKSYAKWLGAVLAVVFAAGIVYVAANFSKIFPSDSPDSQPLNTLTTNTNTAPQKDDVYNRSLWAEWALMLEEDKYEQIIEEATAEIGRNPNNVIAYRMRATAYYNLEKEESARMDIREVLRLNTNPTTAEEYESRCYALKVLNKPDEALADCNRAIELDSQLALAYNIRGTIYHQKQQYDLAVAEYSKAIELSPRKTFFENRAISYRALNNTKLAVKDEKEAAALDKYRNDKLQSTTVQQTSPDKPNSEKSMPKPSPTQIKPIPKPNVQKTPNSSRGSQEEISEPATQTTPTSSPKVRNTPNIRRKVRKISD